MDGKKVRKTVIDVNESYTSKTLWDGSILDNLGGKSSILFKGVCVGRDAHFADFSLSSFFLSKSIRLIGFFFGGK